MRTDGGAKRKPRRRKPAAHPPQAEQIEKNVETLINFPGMNLAKLYRGVVEQSRCVPGKVNDPTYPLSVELLDRCTAKLLTRELAKAQPDAKLVSRLQRGIHGATREQVARYVAESTLGAAALAVDGVNRLLQLRGELKAERLAGHTIDNVEAGVQEVSEGR